MHPAYFAVVMATGIVSVACHLLGFGWLARGMFWLNLIVYPTLWVLTLARLFVHRRRVAEDLLHHGRSVGFFTTVAATNVFGTQCLLIGGSPRAALALWVLGIALWMLLTYTIFTIITIKAEKPSLAEHQWRLAARRGGGAVGQRARRAARPALRCPRTSRPAVLSRHVAGRRHALSLDHLADLLSLHLLRDGASCFRSACTPSARCGSRLRFRLRTWP